MWLVSSRLTLDSDSKPGKKALVYVAPDQRAASAKIKPAEYAALLDDVQGKRVLVLVHGYDNAIEDVTGSYAIIQKHIMTQLRGEYDHVVGYTWPSARSKARWWQAKRNADKVDGTFYELCARLCESDATIDVMTHSLGAHVALAGLAEKVQQKKPLLRNLFLTAAAVDNESVQKAERYFRATTLCERVFNFHSRADDVLGLVYVLAEADAALGWLGPESPELVGPNFHIVNCLRVVNGHSKYKDCVPMYQYIARALKKTTGVPKTSTL